MDEKKEPLENQSDNERLHNETFPSPIEIIPIQDPEEHNGVVILNDESESNITYMEENSLLENQSQKNYLIIEEEETENPKIEVSEENKIEEEKVEEIEVEEIEVVDSLVEKSTSSNTDLVVIPKGVIPISGVRDNTKEKKSSIWNKLTHFIRSRKKKKEEPEIEVIYSNEDDAQITENDAKRKTNYRVLFVVLSVIVLVVGAEYGTKLVTGNTLSSKLFGQGEIELTHRPEPQNSIPEPIITPPDNQDNPIQTTPEQEANIVNEQLKSNLSSVTSSPEFIKYDFKITQVSISEPSIVVQMNTLSKSANMNTLNSLVRAIQIQSHSYLQGGIKQVQVQINQQGNTWSWESKKLVVSFISNLHYQDRNSHQFWWENSVVLLNGKNYKNTPAKINFYVPAKNPEWKGLEKPKPINKDKEDPKSPSKPNKDIDENNKVPAKESELGVEKHASYMDKEDEETPEEKALKEKIANEVIGVVDNSNSIPKVEEETTPTIQPTTQTPDTYTFCPNPEKATDKNCGKVFGTAMKNVKLTFEYPSYFQLSSETEKVNDITVPYVRNIKAVGENEPIKSFKASAYTPPQKFKTLEDAFTYLTGNLEANTTQISYAYTDEGKNPIDLTFLNASNQALKGRIYEEKREGYSYYYFVVVGYVDGKIYEFDFTVEDYILSRSAVENIIRSSKLGK